MMRRLALPAPVLLAPALALVAALSGCARSPADTARAVEAQQATQSALARRLAGLTPGPTEACLPLTVSTSGVQIRGYGPTILYVVGRDLIYRNDTTGGCENLARGDILVTTSPQGRACRGDIASTVSTAGRVRTGSCGLGDFVRYRRER